MRASNKSRNMHKTLGFEPLRLVSAESIQQTEDIFAGQNSPQARRMRADIERVARRPFNILITGETGTGKTQMARQIHRMSARANKPFIELNCANLPEQLVEAELFGHRKGAFTGADYDRKGLFEEADGGILFLDEIGDIPLTVQNRLLKAIDEKQIKRLGTNHYQFFDVQIIAATSRNLFLMIQTGEFREDLHCRLAVLTVEASPLRERREDIPAMIARFLDEAAEMQRSPRNQKYMHIIEKDALELLCEIDYPGNIRTLRNLVYELTTFVDDGQPISAGLAQSAIIRLNLRKSNYWDKGNGNQSMPASEITNLFKHLDENRYNLSAARKSSLHSIVREGDIILPIELCVLRSGETFKQWTARAKRCSIEATRQATGGTMQTAAERLGLTQGSLKSHLQRSKRVQEEVELSAAAQRELFLVVL